MKITYWLYHRGEPVSSVRLSEGTPDHAVRAAAYASHQHIPLSNPDMAPLEFGRMLLRAEVRTFPGGN